MKSEDEKFVQVNFGITKAHKEMLKGGSTWGEMSFNLRQILDEYPKLKVKCKNKELEIRYAEDELHKVMTENMILKDTILKLNAELENPSTSLSDTAAENERLKKIIDDRFSAPDFDNIPDEVEE